MCCTGVGCNLWRCEMCWWAVNVLPSVGCDSGM